MKKFIFGLMVFLGVISSSHAVQHGGLTVLGTGSEANGSDVYVGISPNSNNCLYGGVYFLGDKQLNRVLSVALAAKVSGKTVRVDYEKDATSGQCYGYGIYVE